jgi:hypothetical protein
LGELHNNKCPYCRQAICKDDIHLISTDKNIIVHKAQENKIKDKLDVLIDLINNKPDGSFIVFANFN